MRTINNYFIQMQQAKQRFLTYDIEALIHKLRIEADEHYIYPKLFSMQYRMDRNTGDTDRLENGIWQDANTFEEVMTLLDLICDSRENRFVCGRWKSMRDFGLQFHQNLLEESKDPWAYYFQENQEAFRKACQMLNGKPMESGDIAYSIEVFDRLPVMLQLWFGDDEFPPNVRLLWDENATMYLRYETMYYAKGLLLEKIKEKMEGSR